MYRFFRSTKTTGRIVVGCAGNHQYVTVTMYSHDLGRPRIQLLTGISGMSRMAPSSFKSPKKKSRNRRGQHAGNPTAALNVPRKRATDKVKRCTVQDCYTLNNFVGKSHHVVQVCWPNIHSSLRPGRCGNTIQLTPSHHSDQHFQVQQITSCLDRNLFKQAMPAQTRSLCSR
jgi:hypothetical protein